MKAAAAGVDAEPAGLLQSKQSVCRTLTRALGLIRVRLLVLFGVFVSMALLLARVSEAFEPRSNFPDRWKALWYALSCITTVGYGDYTPETCAGRIAMLSVSLVAIQLATLMTGLFLYGGVAATASPSSQRTSAPSSEARPDVSFFAKATTVPRAHLTLWSLVAFVNVAVLLALSGVIFVAEPRDNIASYKDALWLGYVTITTIGFGDIVPTTYAGKFCAVVMPIVAWAGRALTAGLWAHGLLAADGLVARPEGPSALLRNILRAVAQPLLALSGSAAALSFFCVTVLFAVEPRDNISTFCDAMYLGAITVTGVGYGDLYPVTDAGKAMAVMLAMLSCGAFFQLVGSVSYALLASAELVKPFPDLRSACLGMLRAAADAWPVWITFAVMALLGAALVVASSDGNTCFSQSLWLVLVTLPTVGYGDVLPETCAAKFVTGAIMILSALYVPIGATLVQHSLVQRTIGGMQQEEVGQGSVA